MTVHTDTSATAIDTAGHRLTVTGPDGVSRDLDYDALIVGTGAVSVRPPITGLDQLGPDDGVHLLHSMGDTFAVMNTLTTTDPKTAIIIGAGYIGLEMAEGLTTRGLAVTQIEALPEVLPTVEPELGTLVHNELVRNRVDVRTNTLVTAIDRADNGDLTVTTANDGHTDHLTADLVLVVVGVRPDTDLRRAAGANLGIKNTIAVDEQMRTNLPDVFAAGDAVHTHHRQLGITWLPLGTTAHAMGRVAGENAPGGTARYTGSLRNPSRQNLRPRRRPHRPQRSRSPLTADRGWTPVSTTSTPDDHKAYYPGATPINIRITADHKTGTLLGFLQLIGHRTAEIANRIDTYATALHHGMTVEALSELDLSYTPPRITMGRRPNRRPQLGTRTPPARPAQRTEPTA